MKALSCRRRQEARYTLLQLIDFGKLQRFLQVASSIDLGPCLAINLGMMGPFSFAIALALASVCGAAVFFMLVFLRGFLKDETRPRIRVTGIRFMERRKGIRALSIEHNSSQLDRVGL